jgi:hypothetical protein
MSLVVSRKAESNGVGCAGSHFSKSARSGAPPVISVNVTKTNPRYTSSLRWPTRQRHHLAVRDDQRPQYDLEAWCTQVRVRSLDANLGGGTPGLVPRRFLFPDLSLSIPIRSRRFRFLVKNSGESCSTSNLPVLSLTRASPDCDAGSVA